MAELFAGVGGFRLAAEGYHDEDNPALDMPAAGGFRTVWANQWEPPGTESKQFAWRCYEARFGTGSCVNENIEDVLDAYERGEAKIPDVDMVAGGFPCFVAGTPVLTVNGYKPIEDVAVGDMVLTHEGRYRPVVKTGVKQNAPLVRVSCRGSLPIECTPNHPFMVRTRKRVWRNGKPHFEFSDLHECAAEDLTLGKDFVLVAKLPDDTTDVDVSTEEAWLLGRYVADGHLYERHRAGRKNSYNHKVIYSVGNAKTEEFDSHLITYHATGHHHSTGCERRIITSMRLCNLVHRFTSGNRAYNKSISMDVLSWPNELAKAFLDGYESGDGGRCISNGDESDRNICTTSYDLMLMIGLLIAKVRGRIVSVHKNIVPPTTVIEGRVVNQHDWYSVRYKSGEYKHRQYYEIDGRIYVPVRCVNKLDSRSDVYNFEVEEDHTYVVGQAVVHNCQDYSTARPISQSKGIEGKKGVLWWEIYRFLRLKPEVKYCLFENVDRLPKSPAAQRGRDFAIMLSCLNSLGYSVEWRVVNSAEYGFPQRRKRIFIYAEKDATWDAFRISDGVMLRAFPIRRIYGLNEFDISQDPYEITKTWPALKVSPFCEAGVCSDFKVTTCHIEEAYIGRRMVLGDVVVPPEQVPDEYWVPDEQLPRWEYLKGAKRERRVTPSGHEWWYSEGAMAFPDLLENPSRTILTGEGGRSASRFKHIIKQDGRYRRLVPDELDMLQTFPRGWTDTGMTDVQRAFCMGNALVVGAAHRIFKAILATRRIEVDE